MDALGRSKAALAKLIPSAFREKREGPLLATPADSRFLVASLLGMTKGQGTPSAGRVSDVADTRVPERSNFYGVLNGRGWFVPTSD
jgi:hypothetical protein